jgi:uncharacterized protein
VVRQRVAAELGWQPAGPVRMLTNVRTWGWCFNPLTLYYCFDESGRRVMAVVASVSNTPWGERTEYVLDTRGGIDSIDAQSKRMHVSPFLPMDLTYDFHLSTPSERCVVAIAARNGGQVVFSAGMNLERRPLNPRTLLSMLVSKPLMTHRVSAGIYIEAARLWRKGATFVPHPAQ